MLASPKNEFDPKIQVFSIFFCLKRKGIVLVNSVRFQVSLRTVECWQRCDFDYFALFFSLDNLASRDSLYSQNSSLASRFLSRKSANQTGKVGKGKTVEQKGGSHSKRVVTRTQLFSLMKWDLWTFFRFFQSKWSTELNLTSISLGVRKLLPESAIL